DVGRHDDPHAPQALAGEAHRRSLRAAVGTVEGAAAVVLAGGIRPGPDREPVGRVDDDRVRGQERGAPRPRRRLQDRELVRRPGGAGEGADRPPRGDEALEAELGPTYGPLVVFAAETGLRTNEWVALERRDLDRSGPAVMVQRRYAGGALTPYPKTV